MNKTLPFSEKYSKLNYKVFSTIRRRDKYGNVDNILNVSVGKRGDRKSIGKVKIITKEKHTWNSMDDYFLMYDTETRSKMGAYEKINEFYDRKINKEKEKLTVYWLKWIE